MARHRLLDAKRNHQVHTRIDQTGTLYRAFWARFWLTSPDEYNAVQIDVGQGWVVNDVVAEAIINVSPEVVGHRKWVGEGT